MIRKLALALLLVGLAAAPVDARTRPAAPSAGPIFDDQFDRVVATGSNPGTATSGQRWVTFDTVPAGYSVSVDGAKAVISMPAVNASPNHFDWIATLKKAHSGSFDLRIDWTPTAGNPEIWVLLGSTTGMGFSMGNAFYDPSETPLIGFDVWGGPDTHLREDPATYGFPLGTEVSGRLQFNAGHLYLKVWPTASPEPGAWDLDYTAGLSSFVPVIDSVELVTSDQHFVAGGTYGLGSSLTVDRILLTTP